MARYLFCDAVIAMRYLPHCDTAADSTQLRFQCHVPGCPLFRTTHGIHRGTYEVLTRRTSDKMTQSDTIHDQR